MPGEIEHVTAATHKRVWHDVTNADHSRVTVRFAGGQEAEFTHSDLAAAMKPKFYVLGTEGAVVGSWRQEKVVSRSPIGTLAEDLLAESDAPATMALHHPDGSVTAARRARRRRRSRSTASSPTRCSPGRRCRSRRRARAATSRSWRRRRSRPATAAVRSRSPPRDGSTRGGGVEPVRWGFLGAGMIAATALGPATHAAAGAVLHAAGARDVERARALGPARAYGSYDEVLADPDVEAVYVALANDAHLPWTLAALEAGKPVLCEKPLGLTLAEVEQMAAASARTGLPVVEASWYRWHPRVRLAEEVLRRGDVGPVRHVSAGFTFDGVGAGNYRLDPAKGGGALYDVGCYAVSACLWAVGEGLPVGGERAGRARPDRRRPGHRRGAGLALGRHRGGAGGHQRDRPAVAGRHRRGGRGGAARRAVHLVAGPPTPSCGSPTARGTQRLPVPAVDPYRLMVEEFSSVLRGGPGRLLGLPESAATASVLDAAFASAPRGGSPVSPRADGVAGSWA